MFAKVGLLLYFFKAGREVLVHHLRVILIV